MKITKSVKKSGSKILRGEAFKPRTSPYVFQGKQAEGFPNFFALFISEWMLKLKNIKRGAFMKDKENNRRLT
jgi:hypothetical protein